MAADTTSPTVYAISASGLSVIPLDQPSAADRPVIAARGAVNLASYQTTVAPNTLLSIFGRNLGSTATASALPLPTILGGVCVTLGSTALPLFAALLVKSTHRYRRSWRPGPINWWYGRLTRSLASQSQVCPCQVCASSPGGCRLETDSAVPLRRPGSG